MDSPMRKLGTLAQLVKKMLPVFLLNEAVSPKKKPHVANEATCGSCFF
jgi:hypothetical protein